MHLDAKRDCRARAALRRGPILLAGPAAGGKGPIANREEHETTCHRCGKDTTLSLTCGESRSAPRSNTPENGEAPRHLAENRYSAGWYQPRQNASSQVLLSRMAEMIKPTIE